MPAFAGLVRVITRADRRLVRVIAPQENADTFPISLVLIRPIVVEIAKPILNHNVVLRRAIRFEKGSPHFVGIERRVFANQVRVARYDIRFAARLHTRVRRQRKARTVENVKIQAPRVIGVGQRLAEQDQHVFLARARRERVEGGGLLRLERAGRNDAARQ